MQKIRTFLWFNDNAAEAVELYTSIFKNSRVLSVHHAQDARPGQQGKVLFLEFQLEGQEYLAMNGGPAYQLTPAVSLFVSCETQEEVDTLWDRLLEGGGRELQCGWLTDRFGLSWQIIPNALMKYLWHGEPEKSQRAMQAMMQMVKIDIAAIERAYEGR